jgi:hypothetical protein
MNTNTTTPKESNAAKQKTGGGWMRRLVLCLFRLGWEALVIGLVAVILLSAFQMVILNDKPLWADILAWIAVWSTYDIIKLRRKFSQNVKEHSPGASERRLK